MTCSLSRLSSRGGRATSVIWILHFNFKERPPNNQAEVADQKTTLENFLLQDSRNQPDGNRWCGAQMWSSGDSVTHFVQMPQLAKPHSLTSPPCTPPFYILCSSLLHAPLAGPSFHDHVVGPLSPPASPLATCLLLTLTHILHPVLKRQKINLGLHPLGDLRTHRTQTLLPLVYM